MSLALAKKGKVNAENRKFSSSWTQKCVDIETAEGKLICSLCNVCKGLQPAEGTSPQHLSICLLVSGSFLIGVFKSISSNPERDFDVIWMH